MRQRGDFVKRLAIIGIAIIAVIAIIFIVGVVAKNVQKENMTKSEWYVKRKKGASGR